MLEKVLGVNVTNVHFNSKLIKTNGLFIPIKGENQDGHLYIKDAINNGAIASLWNNKIEIPKEIKDKIKFILVDDTLLTFQKLAYDYRKEVNPVVIGVTGSNGKTTTKEFLDAVLSEKYKVHKNSGNFNNHIGVPLTLLDMPEDTEVCIVEMGMNHAGEISTLTNIAIPNFAIISNIGESHIGLLGSKENIAKAKMEIIEGLINKENIIYDGDEPLLKHLKGHPICDNQINQLIQEDNMISFYFEGIHYEIPTFGLHNAKNAALAIKIGKLLGLDSHQIKSGLKKFKNQSLRLEYRDFGSNSFLLDCYNASLTSMKSALNTFKSINTTKKKIAVLGDIFELGDEDRSTHKQIGELATSEEGLEFWFVGESMKFAYEVATTNKNNHYFPSKTELFNFLDKNSNNLNNSYYLLKASRGMKLEEIYEKVINDYR